MGLSVDIIDNARDLAAIADEWNALAARFRTPLIRHEWFQAAADAFSPPGRLSIRVVRDGGGIAAIAPLVVNPWFGSRRLELLGTSVLAEPSGFLHRDEESLGVLLESILAARTPVLFAGLAEDSGALRYLQRAPRPTGAFTKQVRFESPFIPISNTWEAFSASISSSWRSSFRRSLRRAEESGPAAFAITSPCPKTALSVLEDFMQVEATGWKTRAGTALLVNRPLQAFFREYIRAAAEQGSFRFASMHIGDSLVAGQLVVECSNRLWVLKVGFDEAFSRCSPGILLMHRVIQHAFERLHEGVELLGANEQWISIWKPEIRNHYAYQCYPPSPWTMFSHGIESSALLVRKVRATVKRYRGRKALSMLFTKVSQRFRSAAPAAQEKS